MHIPQGTLSCPFRAIHLVSPERTGFHFIPPPAGGGTPCRRAFKKPTEESKKDRREAVFFCLHQSQVLHQDLAAHKD